MAKNWSTSKKIGVGAFLIICAFTASYFVFALSAANVTPVDEPTTYIVDIYDVLDSTNNASFEDDITYAWYYLDITGMDDDEIADAVWADLTADAETSKELDPEADRIYVGKFSGTDIETRYACTDSRLTFGQDECPLDVLSLGVNPFPMCNQTEDISMSARTTETGGVTFAATTIRTWDIDLTMLDASESGTSKKTEKEGKMSYFDPENGYWCGLAIRIELNETSKAIDCAMVGTYASVSTEMPENTASCIVYLIEGLFTGKTTVQIKLGSDVCGSVADYAITVEVNCGSVAGTTFTETDTQA